MSPDDAPRYIGESVTRLEDRRLLRGEGRFIDDVCLPGMVAMAILRSPLPHARIRAVDLSAARGLPGVIDAFDAADIPGAQPRIPLRLAPFKGFERFLQSPLAADKVRYVGEPVAVVVAEDRYIAEDALACIDIDFDPLPPVATLDRSAAGEVLIHDAAGENLATAYRVGRGDVEMAFRNAEYTRRECFKTNRHAPCPLETRGLIGEFAADDVSARIDPLVHQAGRHAEQVGQEFVHLLFEMPKVAGPFGRFSEADVFFALPAHRVKQHHTVGSDDPPLAGSERPEGGGGTFAGDDAGRPDIAELNQRHQRYGAVGAAARRIEVDRAFAARLDAQ